MTQIFIKTEDGPSVATDLSWDSTLIELAQTIATETKTQISRIGASVTVGGKSYSVLPCATDLLYTSIDEFPQVYKFSSLVPSVTIKFKVSPPQLKTKLVYAAEYFMPFVFGCHTLYRTRNIAVGLFAMHFMIRLYESLFVHHFSYATMPIRRGLIDICYYWIFAALICLNVPSEEQVFTNKHWIAASLYCIVIIFRTFCHRELSIIESSSNKIEQDTMHWHHRFYTNNHRRVLPTSLPFKLVACPNYTAELISWIIMCFILPQISKLWIIAFTICGTLQMGKWSLSRLVFYKELWPDYAPKYAFVPYIF